ncbi:MAG: Sec-independent protein translocase protein TatB [Alphaproteobacteria bacterium]
MLDIGWSEMLVAAVVALVVIGPKDLPRVLRMIGRWAGKARRIAREFQSNIDDMMRESEVADIKKEAESITRYDVGKDLEKSIDPTGDLTRTFDPTGPDTESDGKSTVEAAADDAAAPAEPAPDAATDSGAGEQTPPATPQAGGQTA